MEPSARTFYTFVDVLAVRRTFGIPVNYVYQPGEFLRLLTYLREEEHPTLARALDCSVEPDCDCYFCAQDLSNNLLHPAPFYGHGHTEDPKARQSAALQVTGADTSDDSDLEDAHHTTHAPPAESRDATDDSDDDCEQPSWAGCTRAA